MNLCIEGLSISRPDKNLLQVDLCLLIFGNVLLVSCAISCDYVGWYSLWTFCQDLLLFSVLFFVKLLAIFVFLLLLFLGLLLLYLLELLFVFFKFIEIIFRLFRLWVLVVIFFDDDFFFLSVIFVIVLNFDCGCCMLLTFILGIFFLKRELDTWLEYLLFPMHFVLHDLRIHKQKLPCWTYRSASWIWWT